MATISSLGIGSSLQTANMLEQLQSSEQTRLTPYTTQQTSYNTQISTWGKISSALSALQKSTKSLSTDGFNTFKAGTTKAFTVTTNASAFADSHEVTITQLAKAHKLKTEAQEDANKALGNSNETRQLIIKQNDGTTMNIELDKDETSLSQIAKKINQQNGNVIASVHPTDDGYQLELSSKTTGTDGEMSVSVSGDSSLDNILHTDAGGRRVDEGGNVIAADDKMISVTEAQDAKLTVDGSNYTRSGNSITDVLDGVTLNLTSVSETDDLGNYVPEQLTLTQDTTAIKSQIQDFVKQYNSLLSTTSAASKYVAADTSDTSSDEVTTQSSESGSLVGDSTLRGLVSEIRSTMNSVYGASGADYGSLADIGISMDTTTGQMTLDEGKLDDAIADDPNQISMIFNGYKGSDGIAAKMKSISDMYIGDDKSDKDGFIDTATDSLNNQLDVVKTQIERTQELIDAQVERYRVQFQNLDTTMSQLNSTSSQVSALMSSLG
ncbi:flagellar filament capping protein FliD [Enterobacter pasteurii]|uniref:flagellar filament capping protein FliD n=1 Tax=Enterobacter pasteurii TaxID=3029761 RepID=UPI0011DD7C8F|nr:flagellar filament capping protein FliD [Enterobacter pasteurii]QLA68096.1 flagellar filament capping protein FliD [Enterobacter pasteurii]